MPTEDMNDAYIKSDVYYLHLSLWVNTLILHRFGHCNCAFLLRAWKYCLRHGGGFCRISCLYLITWLTLTCALCKIAQLQSPLEAEVYSFTTASHGRFVVVVVFFFFCKLPHYNVHCFTDQGTRIKNPVYFLKLFIATNSSSYFSFLRDGFHF